MPSAPSGIIVTSPTSSQLSVMWTASPGVVSYYIVYVNGSERASTSNGSTTSLTVSSLSPFTLYLVEVSAVNDGGEGDRSLGTPSITLEDCECVCVCGGGVYAGVWYDCGMGVSERIVFYMRPYCSNNTT